MALLLERGCNMFYALYLKLINLIHKWHWSTASSHSTPSRLPPELVDEILQFTSSEQITQLCKSENNILASLAKYRMRHRKRPANSQSDEANTKISTLTNELTTANAKINTLTNELTTANANITTLANELADVKAKMADARTQSEAKLTEAIAQSDAKMADAIAEAIRIERMKEKSTSSASSTQTTTNAWVTLATKDGYAVGALVLAHSLRQVNTAHKLHVMYTAGVSPELRAQLQQVFDDSTEVNVLDSGDADAENLALSERPDLELTFTKLHCWRLTQYSKCVFLDADRFIVRNCDELFDRPGFSAATDTDIGRPDCFNTGVFVFVPSMETYHLLIQFSLAHGSFDGGDQGLLNAYFRGWRGRESDASNRLPFLYNVTTGAIYSNAAVLKKSAPQVKIIQFLGKQKPWLQHYEPGATEGMTFVSHYYQQWRDVYNQLVQQHLPTTAMVSDQFSAQHHANEPLSSFSHLTERPFNPIEGFDVATAEETATGEELSAAQGTEAEISLEMPIIDPSTSSVSMGLGGSDAGADSFENIQKAKAKSLE